MNAPFGLKNKKLTANELCFQIAAQLYKYT